MQKNHFKYYCWLAILVIIIYWPVSSFLFALKNDALAGYFPAKYFIAESLHNNIIPWWNPYINYGYPMHADFTSSFWSPITWLFSLPGGYSVYTVHLEFLFYCILASWGMFRLCVSLKQHVHAGFIIALCYACGGIFTGNAQHTNWLSAAAILPIVLNAFILFINNPVFKNTVRLSLWSGLFIVCSHPYLIICLLYAFAFVSFAFVKKSPAPISSILTKLLISFLLFLLLTGGYLFSAAELFPYLTRSELLNTSQTSNNFAPGSAISFLLPFSTVSPSSLFGDSDLSMRNAYMGLAGIIFLLVLLFSKKNGYQKVFLITASFFFILSFGGPVSNFITHYFPLLGFIRLISVFRVMGLFFLLVSCAYTLSDFFKGNLKFNINTIIKVLLTINGLLLLYTVFKIAEGNYSIFPSSFNRTGVKNWVENISLEKAIFIQSFIQIPLLILLLQNKIKQQFRLFAVICFLDFFFAVSMNAPFTMVGQKTVKEAQQLLNSAPKGFPLPELKPITQNTSAGSDYEKIFGNWSMYSKEMGTITKAKTYPSLFKTNEKYFSSGLNSVMIHSPFVYASNNITLYSDSITFTPADSNNCFIDKQDWPKGWELLTTVDSTVQLKLTKANPGYFSIESNSKTSYLLVLKQNFYKNWEAYTDEKKTTITRCNYTFMCVAVNAGKHNVVFVYKPVIAKRLAVINIVVLILLLAYSIIIAMKRNQVTPSSLS